MKIEQVCQLTEIRPYVLRFWESEFPEISPSLNETGQKIYSKQDVEKILFIKKLLFEEKLSIDRVRLKLFERETSTKKTEYEVEEKIDKQKETEQNLTSEKSEFFNLQVKGKLQNILERLNHLQQML